MTDATRTSRNESFRPYLVDYGFEGAQWSMTVMARDERDAMLRVQRAAAFGKCVGELMMTIPATSGAGLLTRLICWWRNL